jgi:23S rRNA A2030 N6-methylase RlmJ
MIRQLVGLCFVGLWLLPMVSHAGDMSECAKMEDKDKKHFCLASYAGSGTYCDKIANGERRRECMFKVVRLQRAVTYKAVKPKAAD